MNNEFETYLTNQLTELNEQVAQVRIEIARLKVQSSLWGGLSGLGTAMVVVAWKLFS